jgi:hypothetical protein
MGTMRVAPWGKKVQAADSLVLCHLALLPAGVVCLSSVCKTKSVPGCRGGSEVYSLSRRAFSISAFRSLKR